MELTYSVKITSQRTTTFAFHPTSNKSLVVAGDRLGMLSLWDIVSQLLVRVSIYQEVQYNCSAFSLKDIIMVRGDQKKLDINFRTFLTFRLKTDVSNSIPPL